MADPAAPADQTIDELAERAALAVLGAHGLERSEGESAVSALGWAQGEEISCEAAFRAFAGALIDELGVPDLVAAKLELLGEYKLDYPQDYEPDDLDRMRAEIGRLQELAAGLAADRR